MEMSRRAFGEVHEAGDKPEPDRPAEEEVKITKEMIEAGLLEVEARLPDVVLLAGDGARFVTKVYLAMAALDPRCQ